MGILIVTELNYEIKNINFKIQILINIETNLYLKVFKNLTLYNFKN